MAVAVQQYCSSTCTLVDVVEIVVVAATTTTATTATATTAAVVVVQTPIYMYSRRSPVQFPHIALPSIWDLKGEDSLFRSQLGMKGLKRK